MTKTDFQIGEYKVEMREDAFGLVGSVTNKRYPIRLHAESKAALKRKFERVLTRYLGARQHRATHDGPPAGRRTTACLEGG